MKKEKYASLLVYINKEKFNDLQAEGNFKPKIFDENIILSNEEQQAFVAYIILGYIREFKD